MTEETKVVEGAEVTPVEAPVVTEATTEAAPAEEAPAVEAAPEVAA